jgi:hypothetical protein
MSSDAPGALNAIRELGMGMERGGAGYPLPCSWERCDSKGFRRWGSAKDVIPKGLEVGMAAGSRCVSLVNNE